jgi:hypothetical protein
VAEAQGRSLGRTHCSVQFEYELVRATNPVSKIREHVEAKESSSLNITKSPVSSQRLKASLLQYRYIVGRDDSHQWVPRHSGDKSALGNDIPGSE